MVRLGLLRSMLIFGVTFANLDRAGGMEIGCVGFSIGMACAVVSIICFIRCPRRSYIPKLATFLALWPVLYFAVEIVVVIVGRWIDPSFGHC
jgi:hypothetical protein